MVQCVTYIYDLDIWPQYQNLIFLPRIWVWQNVFALWHRYTKFWHMDVSPWDNMLCTFLTLVWPWPLTYMRVAGGILSEFYSQFYIVKTWHGVESLNDTDLHYFVTTGFYTFHDENKMKRGIWSKSLRVILNCTTQNSTCEVCRNSILESRKMKNENAKSTYTNIRQIKTSDSNTDPPTSQLRMIPQKNHKLQMILVVLALHTF